MALPPGPKTPALGQFLQYGFRPVAFLQGCARRYGDAFTVRFPGEPPLALFCHPEAIREIFTADGDDLHAGEANLSFAPLFGQRSVLMFDGARHLRERRLMLPPFHGERMVAYGRLMREVADRVIDRWPVGRPFAIHPEMQAITLEVILRAVFGLDEGDVLVRVRERLVQLLGFLGGTGALFLLVFPGLAADLGRLSPGGRFARLSRAVDELLLAEIARRRVEGTAGRDDILSMLIDARYEDGTGLSDQELHDEMMTLLVAGHESTATWLAWIFHRVLERPEVLARLGAELAGATDRGPLAPEQVGRLEYLDAVIKETGRLNPVIPWVARRVARPLTIGGHGLPVGVSVAACIYLTHHRPDVWPDPERFEPTRFLGTRLNQYAFFPFGGGERRCLGAAFASYEMKVVVAEVLSRVALRAAPGSKVHLTRRNITYAPSAGMPVVVDARAA